VDKDFHCLLLTVELLYLTCESLSQPIFSAKSLAKHTFSPELSPVCVPTLPAWPQVSSRHPTNRTSCGYLASPRSGGYVSQWPTKHRNLAPF
jgi:hypothetical protein